MAILKEDKRGLDAALRDALVALRGARDTEQPRLRRIDAALTDSVSGQAAGVYVPRRANREYRMLVEQSRFNVLDLVVTSLAQNLFADGFRSTGKNGRPENRKNSPIWDAVWQPNRMDARQAAIYRAAIQHGTSYVLVLPGDGDEGPQVDGKAVPVITPMSACRMTALYVDPTNDEWPELAMELQDERTVTDGATTQRRKIMTVRVFDEVDAYTVELASTGDMNPQITYTESHDLGVVPVVRFRDRYDLGVPRGKVEPLLWLQQQINQTTLGLSMALQYAVFRQRYVTGMEIRVDSNGNEMPPPFNVAVDSILQADSPDTKFGEFSQTDVSGYLDTRDKILLHTASVAQVPPQNLVVGSGISNVPAEALELLAAAHQADIAEHQTSFGESLEQMMRLAGKAMEDRAAWEDMSARVRWRDMSHRAPGQVVDALGKEVQMLGVPPKTTWPRIPGMTDQDLQEMEDAAAEADAIKDPNVDDGTKSPPPSPEQLIAEGASNVVPARAARPARTPVKASA